MDDKKIRGRTTDLRRYPRVELPERVQAVIRDEDGVEHEASVTDLSRGGAGLIADGMFTNDAFVDLHMDGMAEPVRGRVVRKFAEGVGLEFAIDDEEEDRKKAIEEELRAFRISVAGKDF